MFQETGFRQIPKLAVISRTLRDALWPLFYLLDSRYFIAKLSLVQSIFPYFYLICCFSWWRENTSLALFCNLVFIINGNQEICAHIRTGIDKSICLRHLLRSRAVGILKLFSKYVYLASQVRNTFWVTIYYKFHGNNSNRLDKRLRIGGGKKRSCFILFSLEKYKSELYQYITYNT